MAEKKTKKPKKEVKEKVVEETKEETEPQKEEAPRREEAREGSPEFETLKSFEKKYGTRNFIEIALKKTGDDENKFVSISKGFYDREGRKRYKRSLGFAVSEEMTDFVIKSMQEL